MTATVLNPSFAPSGAAAAPAARPFWARVWAAAEAHGRQRALTELRRLSDLRPGRTPELDQAIASLAELAEGRATR